MLAANYPHLNFQWYFWIIALIPPLWIVWRIALIIKIQLNEKTDSAIALSFAAYFFMLLLVFYLVMLISYVWTMIYGGGEVAQPVSDASHEMMQTISSEATSMK
ncbi:MAG: hypothetical protein ACO1O6_11380 [Bacteroidota bacterium]